MDPSPTAGQFRVWGANQAVHGPMTLPNLVAWLKAGRVTPQTWVFSDDAKAWIRARQMPELQPFFQPPSPAAAPARKPATPISEAQEAIACRPGVLRRIKLFADLTDAELLRFVQYMEIQDVPPWTEIVKQGQHGDSLFLILEGELRVRLMIGGHESLLVTLGPGEFFGEISLFDHGPRSADIVSNQPSLLLKISASAFARLVKEAPDLAAPFLVAMGKTLTARIRADNKRFRDSINFARAAEQVLAKL